MNLRFIISAIISTLFPVAAFSVAPALSITSASGLQPLVEDAESSTGLQKIYVVDNADGANLSINSAGATVSVSTFGSAGAAYATPASTSVDASGLTTLSLPAEDTGLIIDVAGDRAYYYWIVDYSKHDLKLNGLSYDSAESDCTTAALRFDGSAAPITYYTINGAPKTLSRDIHLNYSTLKFDADFQGYQSIDVDKTFASLTSTVHADQSLCATRFTLSGDRFKRFWGDELIIESSVVDPVAVEAHASMTRIDSIADNMSNSGGDNGPAELQFTSEITDAVKFVEWQTSAYSDFSIIDLRFNGRDFDLQIDQTGTTYIRLLVANDSGDCQWTSDIFEVSIGASKLLCPNAFSPGDQNGINDEWKVSYSSLTQFECNIFNRWGVHIKKLTHPSQGWDGRYRGKLVESGVYYYVIRARGADGVDYKLSGDINVINYSIRSNPTSQE